MRPPLRETEELHRQALQDFPAQFLRFAEKFLVFDEDAVQLERLVGGEFPAQHHVAHVDGIGQGRVFGEFFKGGRGIVVVHAFYSIASDARLSYTSEVAVRGCNASDQGFVCRRARLSTVSTVAARRPELLSSSRVDFSK
jgi:hypothetical protein